MTGAKRLLTHFMTKAQTAGASRARCFDTRRTRSGRRERRLHVGHPTPLARDHRLVHDDHA
ncbi:MULTISPECIES: hypothetical protein, partial [unclassified Burkholderia]|uniref:hypothetical protein n=1 Tax=unclassified Burkholderia TaxID=2613784 RepID=UPI001C8AAE45